MNKQEFDTNLKEAGRGGGVMVEIPFDVKEVFGTKGRVPVKALIDGVEYRGSLAPMGGCHVLGVLKEIREKIGKQVPDSVHIVLEVDEQPRTVELPEDFKKALEMEPKALAAYEKMSYTHKKEYVRSIVEAKKAETRHNRIEKAIEMLLKK